MRVEHTLVFRVDVADLDAARDRLRGLLKVALRAVPPGSITSSMVFPVARGPVADQAAARHVHDQPVPIARGYAMLEALPDATLVKIPDSGHTSNLENAETVNYAILGFLDRLYRRRNNV